MADPVAFHDGRVVLHAGDCLDVLKTLPDASIDSVVTDPPYALVSITKRFGKEGAAPAKVPEGGSGAYMRASAGFMGKHWDTGERAFAVEFWAEVFRMLKPGGHVLAFAATRTQHRLACAIEDAGFEIRDMIAWLYGTGFPKSHDVSRAVDALDGLEARRARALRFTEWMRSTGITSATIARLTDSSMASHYLTAGEQPEVATAEMFNRLRPALPAVPDEIEELVRARTVESENLKRRQVVGQHKDQAQAARWREDYEGSRAADPKAITAAFSEEAKRWAGWGTALKPALEPVTVARKPLAGTVAETVRAHGTGALNIDGCRIGMSAEDRAYIAERIAGFNNTRSIGGTAAYGGGETMDRASAYDASKGRWPANVVHDDSDEVVAAFPAEAGAGGRASGPSLRGGNESVARGRFSGLPEGMEPAYHGDSGSAARFFFSAKADADDRIGSKHPTVKPVDLMRWLVRLVTPPGGTVLDPFAGTGTTGEAAWREGFRAVLIEREEEYRADIARRMALTLAGPALRRAESAKARDRKPSAPLALFGEA